MESKSIMEINARRVGIERNGVTGDAEIQVRDLNLFFCTLLEEWALLKTIEQENEQNRMKFYQAQADFNFVSAHLVATDG